VEWQTIREQVDDSIFPGTHAGTLSGFFGGLALLLAAVGLYGVVAYGTARRAGEIGIRIALGAERGQVLWMVLARRAGAGRPGSGHRAAGFRSPWRERSPPSCLAFSPPTRWRSFPRPPCSLPSAWPPPLCPRFAPRRSIPIPGAAPRVTFVRKRMAARARSPAAATRAPP